MTPLISIIIVNYNGIKWLKNCLDSLSKQGFGDYEIILVDNCSIDGSQQFIKKYYPNITLLELKSNFGFAKANNIALKYAKGKYLLFLNNDTIVQDGWLERLIKAKLKNPEYKLLASIQLPDQEGGKTRDLTVYFEPSVFFNKSRKKKEIVDSLFASGACFLVNREWIREVGYLFDESYFMSSEDLDLSLRTVFCGGKIGYVVNSRLIHFVGGSSRTQLSKISKLSIRNEVITAYKLFEKRYLIKILLAKFLHILVRTIIKGYEIKKNIYMFFGYFEGLAIMVKYKGYRLHFKNSKKVGDKEIIKNLKYKSKAQKLLYNFLVR